MLVNDSSGWIQVGGEFERDWWNTLSDQSASRSPRESQTLLIS